MLEVEDPACGVWLEGEGQVKLSRRLRDAIAPKGAPVFLVGVIAFLVSLLVSLYIRFG